MSETRDMPQAGTDVSGGSGKPFGPVAAVFVAAGIASLVLGILTTLAEASGGIKSALEWMKSVGPLSGKTIVSSVVFFVVWGVLRAAWKDKSPKQKTVWTATAILVAIGLVMTFPIFFLLFAPAE